MKKLIAKVTVFIWLLLPLTVWAEEETDKGDMTVYEARNGIVQVNLVYADDDNEAHVLQGGSGFLIGEDEGTEYLLTNWHFLNVTEELRNKVAADFTLTEEEKNRLQLQIQVVVKGDITVNASVVTNSEELDFAVLRLSQKIYDRVPLVFNTDADTVVENTGIYALGFAESIKSAQGALLYTSDDVSIMNGTVSETSSVNGILYIKHSAVISGGNTGGPLLNEAGEVIGMNQEKLSDGHYYSVHISEIASVLEALGISFLESKEEVAPVDISVLEAAIAAAGNKNTEGYTKESTESFLAVLAETEKLLQKEEITQEEIDSGLLKLKEAEGTLVLKSGVNYLLLGGIAILLLLAAMIFLLVCIVRKGDKKADMPAPIKEKTTEKSSYSPFQQNMPGETTLLKPARESSVGETSILNSDFSTDLMKASLIRSKTNENITINKMIFYLGKDGQRADYCVSGNPSISRSHAAIRQTDGGFYLEDLHATNGTFLNGVQLQPAQSVKLSNGDRIRLANEEFRFEI